MKTTTRPSNVPACAIRKENNDGSTSWVWQDEDGFNNLTVNCPPTAPIYFNPTNGVPIPPPKDNDYYLHCAYEMEAMGGSFASLIARAYYAADRDNKQRLIAAFGHLFDRYAPTQGESK